jgi:hypothetical protein
MRENIAKFLAHVKVPKIVRSKRLRVLECSNDTGHKVESYGMIKRALEFDIGGVQVERGEMNGVQSLRMLSEAVKSGEIRSLILNKRNRARPKILNFGAAAATLDSDFLFDTLRDLQVGFRVASAS